MEIGGIVFAHGASDTALRNRRRTAFAKFCLRDDDDFALRKP